MTDIRGQISEVSSQKAARDLTLSPLPFALSLVSALLLALCSSAEAQQQTKVPHIGWLGTRPAAREVVTARTIPPNVLARADRVIR